MQATAPIASAADRALLIFRTELALLTDDPPPRVAVDVELTADDAAVSEEMPVEFEVAVALFVAGATAERAPMVDHVAAELAALLP